MFYKAARVEYHPVGVVGAIVPWNYPFHNVFNPLTAALFAGNGLVIKVNRLSQFMVTASMWSQPGEQLTIIVAGVQVSEHASWSSQFYGRIISATLQAVGDAHTEMYCRDPRSSAFLAAFLQEDHVTR